MAAEAWIQLPLGKLKIELIGEPHWRKDLPNGRWQIWIEYRDPTPRNYACTGTPVVKLSAVHPMNKEAKAVLKNRPPKPPKPSETWL